MSSFQGIFWSFFAVDKNGNIRGEFKRSDVTSRLDALSSKKHVTFVKGLREPTVGDSLTIQGLGPIKVIEIVRGSGFITCTLDSQQYSDVLVAALTLGPKSSRIWLWERDNAWSHLQTLNATASGGKREEWIRPGQREEFLAYAKSKVRKDPFAN